ncbi:MAG: pyridoxal-phosphate dependent enzyme, partial [Pseudomonadota bacterium]
EIAAQARAAQVRHADVLVCCGGGGLASGIALALEAEAPGLRLRPVEPEAGDDTKRSLAAGERIGVALPIPSICDASVTPMPGELTFPVLQRLAGPGLTVGDDDALTAMAHAFLRLKLVAEPGGAVALAAALFRGAEIEGDTVIAVVTGGNVDPAMFARALETLG